MNRKKFNTQLKEINVQYGYFVYYSEVRRLSSGMILQKSFNLLKEINCFITSENGFNNNRIEDLTVLIDITIYFNAPTFTRKHYLLQTYTIQFGSLQ